MSQIRRWRGIAAGVVPITLGLAGSLVAWLTYPGAEFYLRFALPLLPLGIGAGLSALLGTVVLTRHLLVRAEARGRVSGQEERREARRRFLARLDHELKNPVTAIRAAAEVAAMEEVRPDLRENLDVIRAQTTRLATLVEGLRKVSNIETQTIECEEVNVEELIAEVVADLSEQTRTEGAERRVSVSLPRVPWRLPTIRGDVDLLYLALWNVLSNAAKYSPPTSAIEIRGREQDGWVVLEVADSGIGIPVAEQAQVFEELVRGSQVRALPGSGIGLALVKAVVQRHGGAVSVRSRPGQGSRFELWLPTASGAGAPIPRPR